MGGAILIGIILGEVEVALGSAAEKQKHDNGHFSIHAPHHAIISSSLQEKMVLKYHTFFAQNDCCNC